MYKAYNLQSAFKELFYLIKPGIYRCQELENDWICRWWKYSFKNINHGIGLNRYTKQQEVRMEKKKNVLIYIL